jgi:hypothetical protein
MKINRRKLLSLLGASPAIFAGSAAANGQNQKNQKIQTNPYYQVANMSYSRSVSIDKWM